MYFIRIIDPEEISVLLSILVFSIFTYPDEFTGKPFLSIIPVIFLYIAVKVGLTETDIEKISSFERKFLFSSFSIASFFISTLLAYYSLYMVFGVFIISFFIAGKKINSILIREIIFSINWIFYFMIVANNISGWNLFVIPSIYFALVSLFIRINKKTAEITKFKSFQLLFYSVFLILTLGIYNENYFSIEFLIIHLMVTGILLFMTFVVKSGKLLHWLYFVNYPLLALYYFIYEKL